MILSIEKRKSPRLEQTALWSGSTAPGPDEFFREAFRSKSYGLFEELQQDLDQSLQYYNYTRPHQGYRNMGRRTIQNIEEGKLVKEKGAQLLRARGLTVREILDFYRERSNCDCFVLVGGFSSKPEYIAIF